MKGTLFWLANGTIAIDTGVSRPPKSAATFSRCTSSRAATTPLAGLLSSSRTTNSTFLPRTPPFALISSIATDRPRTIASPDLADWPDIAATRPSLMVSSAIAGSASVALAAAARRRRRLILGMLLCRAMAIPLESDPAISFANRVPPRRPQNTDKISVTEHCRRLFMRQRVNALGILYSSVYKNTRIFSGGVLAGKMQGWREIVRPQQPSKGDFARAPAQAALKASVIMPTDETAEAAGIVEKFLVAS